jgi:hypothetical protein
MNTVKKMTELLMKDLVNEKKVDQVLAFLERQHMHVYTPKDDNGVTFVERWLKSRWGRPEWIKILRNRSELINLLSDTRKAQVSKEGLLSLY